MSTAIGGGVSNYMSVGEYPDNGQWRDADSMYYPSGVIFDRNLSEVMPYDHEQVKEHITSSWYEYEGGDEVGLHPWDGETEAKPGTTQFKIALFQRDNEEEKGTFLRLRSEWDKERAKGYPANYKPELLAGGDCPAEAASVSVAESDDLPF